MEFSDLSPEQQLLVRNQLRFAAGWWWKGFFFGAAFVVAVFAAAYVT